MFPQRGESLVKKPRSTSVARRCITPKRLIKEENNIALELEKRLAYIHDFFASLSDEEFVQMMIECGIEKSKN